MLTHMEYAQVFQPIVGFDAIYVINVFPFFQLAPQVLLHNPSVFKIANAIDSNAAIFIAVIYALMFGITLLRAKLFGFLFGFRAAENRLATQALNGAFLIFSVNSTPLRAKFRFVFAICFDFKRRCALLANQRNHAALVAAESGGCNG